MQALVKSKDSKGLWMEEVPEPELGHDDAFQWTLASTRHLQAVPVPNRRDGFSPQFGERP